MHFFLPPEPLFVVAWIYQLSSSFLSFSLQNRFKANLRRQQIPLSRSGTSFSSLLSEAANFLFSFLLFQIFLFNSTNKNQFHGLGLGGKWCVRPELNLHQSPVRGGLHKGSMDRVNRHRVSEAILGQLSAIYHREMASVM
jgi:hypothetical protein